MQLAWHVVDLDDLDAFLAPALSQAVDRTDSSGVTSKEKAVVNATNRVRAAIGQGGRVPLSMTAVNIAGQGEGTATNYAVPPGAVTHVLVLAARSLVAGTPDEARFVESDSFNDMLKEANDYLKGCGDGSTVPEQPLSAEADPAWTSLTRWGDAQGTSDLGTAGGYNLQTDGPATSSNPPNFLNTPATV